MGMPMQLHIYPLVSAYPCGHPLVWTVNFRMAKTTEWLNAILDYNEEGEVEHISGVWPSFLTIRVSL